MLIKTRLLILLCFVMPQASEVNGLFRFSKVKCEADDPTFVSFHYCRLKPVNRYTSAFSFKMTILRDYIDNFQLHLEFFEKSSSQIYRLHYVNTTYDACKFFRSPQKYPIPNLIYQLYRPYTNMNHTCPFRGDIYLTNLSLSHNLLPLPMPTGEYLLKINVIMARKPLWNIHVWFVFEEPGKLENTTKIARKKH